MIRRILTFYAYIVLAAFLLPQSASALQSVKNDYPDFYDFGGHYSLARVIGPAGSQVHFSDPKRGLLGDPVSLQKAYVVPGDLLLVTQPRGAWIHAWYLKNQTTGWLPVDKLKITPFSQTPALQEWSGEWEEALSGEDFDIISIQVDAKKSELIVTGKKSVRINKGNVHIGDFEGLIAKPMGDRATAKDPSPDGYSCVVYLRLVGPVLIVSENGQCGGAGVSFESIYCKKQKKFYRQQ